MLKIAQELKTALGISINAAELYVAALQRGPLTLTELARETDISRTIIPKPLKELLDNALLQKQTIGKRVFYYAINPQELPAVIEKKKQTLIDISNLLLQQISAPDQDLQVRWYSGISGIQTAIKEFFTKSKGDFRQFENANTYQYIGVVFGGEIVGERVKLGKTNKLIVIGDKESTGWYKDRILRAKKELREIVVVSAEEYPFHANVAISDNLVLIFEYQKKPFALLIDNSYVARSIASIHQMVWERYKIEK